MEMETKGKKYSIQTMLTLIVIGSALTALILSGLFVAYINSNSYEPEEEIYSDFYELIDIIDNYFIGDFDLDEIIDHAKRAAVASLDDMWSFYMTPHEYNTFLATANNRHPGIGVSILYDEETGGVRVVRVNRGSGAYYAGILANDILVAVDDESIIGFSIDEIRDILQRPIGDTADVTVLRDGEYIVLSVEYKIVVVNPVSYAMLPGNIGHLILRNFDEGAGENFIDGVNALIDMGAVAIIYDVRNNGGGRVTEVTKILDFLLPEGEIFITVDRTGEENITWSDEYWIDLPAVVLVNRHSYSGAEFFAAMLSEYDYAATVGEQTTGKNRMQSLIPLSSGGAINISTGHFVTRNRVDLFNIGGFTPGYIIDMTDEELIAFAREELNIVDDPQLQKALSLLENYR